MSRASAWPSHTVARAHCGAGGRAVRESTRARGLRMRRRHRSQRRRRRRRRRSRYAARPAARSPARPPAGSVSRLPTRARSAPVPAAALAAQRSVIARPPARRRSHRPPPARSPPPPQRCPHGSNVFEVFAQRLRPRDLSPLHASLSGGFPSVRGSARGRRALISVQAVGAGGHADLGCTTPDAWRGQPKLLVDAFLLIDLSENNTSATSEDCPRKVEGKEYWTDKDKNRLEIDKQIKDKDDVDITKNFNDVLNVNLVSLNGNVLGSSPERGWWTPAKKLGRSQGPN
ncbi:Protein of unknown function [Gryllus bimaculatus]|nr:Protein of unknown function [Gryllus bimaculatus]